MFCPETENYMHSNIFHIRVKSCQTPEGKEKTRNA